MMKNRFARILWPIAHKALRAVSHRFTTGPLTQATPLLYNDGRCALDELRVLPDGCVWISGWCIDPFNVGTPEVILGDESLRLSNVYRTFRPDVARALDASNPYLGFEAIYASPVDSNDGHLRVHVNGAVVHEATVRLTPNQPHYAALLESKRVYTRAEIYGSGLPVATTTTEILALALSLSGKTLDFGCGAGYLVQRMREGGIDASGIEIDRPEIRTHMLAGSAPYIRLYDGSFPLPFADASFESAIAVEVIEHIPTYELAVAELARIVSRQLIVTVPDASSIPRLFHAHVVPWHLLESTHFNFFTLQSLEALLSRHFSTVRMRKIGRISTNGIPWYTSVVAVCTK